MNVCRYKGQFFSIFLVIFFLSSCSVNNNDDGGPYLAKVGKVAFEKEIFFDPAIKSECDLNGAIIQFMKEYGPKYNLSVEYQAGHSDEQLVGAHLSLRVMAAELGQKEFSGLTFPLAESLRRQPAFIRVVGELTDNGQHIGHFNKTATSSVSRGVFGKEDDVCDALVRTTEVIGEYMAALTSRKLAKARNEIMRDSHW